MSTGRRDDPTLVKCECGWNGTRAELIHEYKLGLARYEEDVEPIDQCPNCREEL